VRPDRNRTNQVHLTSIRRFERSLTLPETLDDLRLAPHTLFRFRDNVERCPSRDDDDAVGVSYDEVSGMHGHVTDGERPLQRAGSGRVFSRPSNRKAPGEDRKLEARDRFRIPDATVDD
jgi:hypothetical protein